MFGEVFFMVTLFFSGNEYLHILTSQHDYMVRFDIEDFFGNTGYGVYNNFIIGDEVSQYKISISEFSGNIGKIY